MHRHINRGRLTLLALVGVFCVGSPTFADTLRVVSYNIEADINGATMPLPGINTVLQGIGQEIVGSDPAQPLDILGLEETTSNSATVAPIVSDLNGDYTGANYRMSPYQATQSGGNTGGNGPNALVYNANTLTLLASVGVGTPSGSTNGEYRQVVRYEFQPIKGSSPFYIYVEHAKSGDSTYNNARNAEASIVRSDEAALATILGYSPSVIYMGDLNQSPAPTNLTASGEGQGIDPYNGSAAKQYLTDSSTSLYYRDDYQLMTANVDGGTGTIRYVPTSLHAFGNNGTTPVNGTTNSPSTTGGSNTDLSYMTTANGYSVTQAQILSALTTASDHLPIDSDYTFVNSVAAPEPSAAILAYAAIGLAFTRRRSRVATTV